MTDHYVYILYSVTREQYYTGFTHDLETRLFKHNAGSTPSTRPGIPWRMVYSETFKNKHDAIRRESEIKKRKSRIYIEKLIAQIRVV
ncbi:MAG: GIY-YIG nuclease family protein [Bacteroidota bacterium]